MTSLAKTNKYLATSEQRKQAVRVTIATSSAIEGIHAPFKQSKTAKYTAGIVGNRPLSKRSKP